MKIYNMSTDSKKIPPIIREQFQKIQEVDIEAACRFNSIMIALITEIKSAQAKQGQKQNTKKQGNPDIKRKEKHCIELSNKKLELINELEKTVDTELLDINVRICKLRETLEKNFNNDEDKLTGSNLLP